MKRQFWLVGIVLLAVLSACRSKSDGPTDTYSSGVISIAADESFEPIIQEEIDVFESLYPWPELSLATRRKSRLLIYF